METATTTVTSQLPPSTTELQFESRTTKASFVVISELLKSSSMIQTTSVTTTSITADRSTLANQRETTTAWILFAIMSILLSGSLTINVTVLAFLVYKKRQVGGENGQRSEEYEIEGNPCYEATGMKQSSEREEHVYEIVREKRAK